MYIHYLRYIVYVLFLLFIAKYSYADTLKSRIKDPNYNADPTGIRIIYYEAYINNLWTPVSHIISSQSQSLPPDEKIAFVNVPQPGCHDLRAFISLSDGTRKSVSSNVLMYCPDLSPPILDTPPCRADFNGDGAIGLDDVSKVLMMAVRGDSCQQ